MENAETWIRRNYPAQQGYGESCPLLTIAEESTKLHNPYKRVITKIQLTIVHPASDPAIPLLEIYLTVLPALVGNVVVRGYLL